MGVARDAPQLSTKCAKLRHGLLSSDFAGEANLNDQPLTVPVLSHDAVTDGGTLRLRMTATPN
jgi:putative alpha-1,2-mannosidase